MRILITEYFMGRLKGRFATIDVRDLIHHLSDKLRKVQKLEEWRYKIIYGDFIAIVEISKNRANNLGMTLISVFDNDKKMKDGIFKVSQEELLID
jgi:hypothetical protein